MSSRSSRRSAPGGRIPCFDEPDSKVPWQITAGTCPQPDGRSPTPRSASDTLTRPWRPGWSRSARPQPLPSYLVAFAVGAASPLSMPARLGLAGAAAASLCRRAGAVTSRYVVEHTAPLLAWLEDYFGIAVPVRRSSTCSRLPLTAGFGAMEQPRPRSPRQSAPAWWRGVRTYTLGFQRAFAAVTPTSSPTNGLATWSPSRGGTISGSTRPSPAGWATRSCRRGGPRGTRGYGLSRSVPAPSTLTALQIRPPAPAADPVHA